MSQDIDLNTLLPSESPLEPLFENDKAYENFKQRYRDDVQLKLKEQEIERRRSEEEARHRVLS